MLYLLFILLIVLLVINYKLIKDLLSPSLLLIGVFVISTFFAIIGNTMWNQHIYGYGPLVVIIGVGLIFVGELIVRSFAEKRKLIDFNKAVPNAISSKEIKYSRLLIGMFGVFCLFATYYCYKETMALAYRNGYVDGNGNMLQVVRMATLYLGDGTNALSSILGFIVRGIGFVCMAIFLHNVFCSDKFFKGIKENVLLLIPVVFLLFINYLSTSRNGFILIIVVAFFIAFDRLRVVRKVNIVKLGVCGLGLVALFIVVFFAIGSVRGGTNSIIGTLSTYAGSSIVALDSWLAENIFSGHNIGSESFVGIHQLISKIIPGYEVNSLFSEFVTFANGSETNIFTCFRAWINDFGYVGLVAISLLVGIIFTSVYLIICYGKYNDHSVISKCIFGYFFYGLIYGFATPELTTSLFSITQICDIVCILSAYYLISRVQKCFDKYGVQRIKFKRIKSLFNKKKG